MRPSTIRERRRLYLLARALVARYYRRALTLEALARALSCSPRQLQRAYAQFGERTFKEDLAARRMGAALELLAGQSISVRDVARLVGYSDGAHFARAFRRRYGLSPARFRERARSAQRVAGNGSGSSRSTASVSARGSETRITVPPPAAGSARIEPPCCSTT
jgi:AraC family transcriptional regulator, regulatory protein of adaptative response / methylphosphotriester-DNA alkyltransferase methyltransferase